MPAPGLHVLALVKQVPQHEVNTDLDTSGRLVRAAVPAELNPFCRRAVAHAVRIAGDTGGTSTALTMGPRPAADVLREAAACGVDRTVLVSDPAFARAVLASTFGRRCADFDERDGPHRNLPCL